MAKPLRVTVYDPETGTEQTGHVEPGNYMVICAAPCYLHSTDGHANGTTVITVKGRSAQFIASKEVGHG